MSKSLLAAAVMSVMTVLPVRAQTPHDWFILTPTTDCIRAAYVLPKTPNPLLFHYALRSQGATDDLKKLPYGGINIKLVGKPGDGMFWFPDHNSCLTAQANVRKAGEPDLADLQ